MSTTNNPERWWVDPPTTFEALQAQATKSVVSALPSRRAIVECAVPELDPTSEQFKPQELVSFTHDLVEPLLAKAGLPKSKPHIKLLFNSQTDATLAGASIMTTSLPVSMLGHPSSIGPPSATRRLLTPRARCATSSMLRAAASSCWSTRGWATRRCSRRLASRRT